MTNIEIWPDQRPRESFGFLRRQRLYYSRRWKTSTEQNFKGKADIFAKQTIRPRKAITHVDTSAEALAVSIGEKAKVDIGYMSALTGKEHRQSLRN